MTHETNPPGVSDTTQPETAASPERAQYASGEAFERWVAQSPEHHNEMYAGMGARDCVELGFRLAIHELIYASMTDVGAQAVHRNWVAGMQKQHRDVATNRLRWEILLAQEKVLDSFISEHYMLDLVRTVADGDIPSLL